MQENDQPHLTDPVTALMQRCLEVAGSPLETKVFLALDARNAPRPSWQQDQEELAKAHAKKRLAAMPPAYTKLKAALLNTRRQTKPEPSLLAEVLADIVPLRRTILGVKIASAVVMAGSIAALWGAVHGWNHKQDQALAEAFSKVSRICPTTEREGYVAVSNSPLKAWWQTLSSFNMRNDQGQPFAALSIHIEAPVQNRSGSWVFEGKSFLLYCPHPERMNSDWQRLPVASDKPADP